MSFPSPRSNEDYTYIARFSKDDSGEFYTRKIWKSNSVCEEVNCDSYICVKIYKIIEPKFEQLIHEYRESTIGPHSNFMIKTFVKINGIEWFIGMLNYKVRYYVNCETGKSYTDTEDKYNTWHYIKSVSPNGTHIIVNASNYGGNSDRDLIYDISSLDKNGAILKNLTTDIPPIFNTDYTELIFMKFTGKSEKEIKITYKKDFDDEDLHEMGIYYIQ